jgi:hypothetical protein
MTRYLFGFMCVCALAGTSPLSASAQAGEEGATPEPSLEEPASDPAPEEAALQLKLDAAGVGVVPSPPRTIDGYTLEEMDVRVRRAKIGIGSSALAFFVGGILLASGLSGDCGWGGGAQRESCDRLAYAGTALAAGGAVGMIATGILLGVRKRKLRRLQEAHYGRPHRVQWDLAQSRLVF